MKSLVSAMAEDERFRSLCNHLPQAEQRGAVCPITPTSPEGLFSQEKHLLGHFAFCLAEAISVVNKSLLCNMV